jgi:hypothetical protein
MPLTVVGTKKKTGDTFVPPAFLKFYERTMCCLATTAIAIATVITAATSVGTKVTELVAHLAVEFSLERDFDRSIATRCTVFAWCAIAVATATTVVTATSTTVIATTTVVTITALAWATVSAAASATAWDVVSFFVDRSKADLALVVNIINANANDITQSEDVFHVVHALAIAQLADVHESVTSRKDVDECTELGGAHNATVIDRIEFCRWRINNREDASFGIFHAEVVWRTNSDDSDCAVIAHCDVCTGFLLDGVDDLALWSDDFADLVQRNGERNDLRCGFCNA